MRIEGKILSKETMIMKDKEVGFVTIRVIWALKNGLEGSDMKLKIDVYTEGDELIVGEKYFIEITRIGTQFRAKTIRQFTSFVKAE